MSTIQYRIDAPTLRAIARDAYIFGFPLVDHYRIQYSYFVDRGHPEYKAPWNQLFHNPSVYTPHDRAVQTPNSDTPYSQLGADLRAEPLILTVPEVEADRYYCVQFVDMYTHNFAYLGSRTTGNAAGIFMLAGPRWHGEPPDGIAGVIHCETDFAFLCYRTQLRGALDLPRVQQIQRGYQVQTLSSFLGTKRQPQPRKLYFMKPLDVDEERTDMEFYVLLNYILQFCPMHPSEVALFDEWSRLGIGAGRTFHKRGLPGNQRREIHDGMADAWHAYRHRAKQIATGELGTAELFGSRADLGTDYLGRMVGAVDGIYGNSPAEALYCVYSVDYRGERLDGAKQVYQLRFAPGQLPPVRAFWSLTMYDLPSRLLVPNQMNRYLINSSMLPELTRDEDGGITLFIQRNHPAPSRETNWLPAADGPFMMALRLYWPESDAIDGRWQAPQLEPID
jgi:hypothetical protein